VNFYSCRSREVIGHWAKRGRPRQTQEPLRPSPRQLQLELPSGQRDIRPGQPGQSDIPPGQPDVRQGRQDHGG
jgi:hypothetical protein